MWRTLRNLRDAVPGPDAQGVSLGSARKVYRVIPQVHLWVGRTRLSAASQACPPGKGAAGIFFHEVPQNPDRIAPFASLSDAVNEVVIERQSGAAWQQPRYMAVGLSSRASILRTALRLPTEVRIHGFLGLGRPVHADPRPPPHGRLPSLHGSHR